MNSIPRWARRVLKQEDRKTIAVAAAVAEKRCGVEFVPVVVRRSSAVGHIGLTIGLVLLLGLYFFRFVMPQRADAAWQPWYTPIAEAVIAGCIGWACANLKIFQRLFTPYLDRVQSVERRAYLEFYKHHVEETKTGEGILLFVSLMERRAVVLCGRSLSTKIPSQAWHEISRMLLEGARKRRLGDGMAQAIAKSSDIVAKHFPKRRKSRHMPVDRLAIKE